MRLTTLLVPSLMAVAVACGFPQQATPSGDADGQPKRGGTLVMRETAEVEERDPTMAQQGGIKFITPRAFDGLLDVKSSPDLDFNEWVVVPKLAERWEVSQDAKKYTFYLRKGVKFANLPPVHGRELTAADVKWSLEYIARIGQFKDVKFPLGNQLQPRVDLLERVEAPDAYTAVAYFKEPFVPFLSYAAMPHIAMMPHEIYDQYGRFSDYPIGSGPWQLDKENSQTGARMVYTRNSDYWQTGKPYVDEVRSLVLSDENAAFAAFQTKQLDVLNSVQLKHAEQLKKNAPSARFVAAIGNHGLRFYYNHTIAPFNDVRFRRALSFATDREEFVKTFTQGQGQWGVDGGIPGLFTQDELKKMSPYDPEQAKQLLRESGYADKPVSIETLHAPAGNDQLTSDIVLLQAQWKKVGIEIRIVNLERVDVSRRQRAGDFMMTPSGTGPGEPEPDFYFYNYFHSKSRLGGNDYRIADPKIDAFANAQRAETDPAKRREIWRQQAKYIHDNGNALWIYYSPSYHFMQSYVMGYYPSNPNSQKPTVDTWLDK